MPTYLERPHILYLVPDLFGPPGGIARHCKIVCQVLTQANAAVSVVALNDQAAQYDHTLFPKMQYWACGQSRPLFIRRSVSALRQQPAIILVAHPHHAQVGWMLAKISGAKLVVFMHGVDVWHRLPLVRRWALRHANQLIAVSRFTAKRAAEVNGVPFHKTQVLHHCIDTQFTGQPSTKKPSGVSSLLTVSRIARADDYKGHDYVLRALPTLLTRFPTIKYNIVGDGDGRAALEALAARLQVAHAVHFHGTVSSETLIDLYAEASVFIMPSRGEGFGFVFLEAMSQGIPVIGGNADATPEVIVDGETGYLVNPTSSDQIVDAVTRLLFDESLRRTMGEAGRRRAAQVFSYETFRNNLLAILNMPIAGIQRA